MKRFFSDQNVDLNVFAWIGLFVLVVMIVAPILFGYIVLMKYQGQGQNTEEALQTALSEPLGELGSHCGGPSRLPCGQGLLCVGGSPTSTRLGICEKSPSSPSSSLRQLGESCADTGGHCASGLYCRAPGTCARIDAQAPYIVSVKLEGMQPEEGVYYGEPGKTYTITVQTANTTAVDAKMLSPTSTSRVIGAMKKGKGGIYSASLTVGAGFRGQLELRVASAGGDLSWMTVGVASKE